MSGKSEFVMRVGDAGVCVQPRNDRDEAFQRSAVFFHARIGELAVEREAVGELVSAAGDDFPVAAPIGVPAAAIVVAASPVTIQHEQVLVLPWK